MMKEESIMFAKQYLEDMLSFFGLNIDVYATMDEDVIELSVPSTHLNGFLIGQRGDTLRSMQFLVSSSLKNNDYEYTRVNIDIADYKKQRQDRLAEKVEEWIEVAISKNENYVCRPMNAADRRVVHKTVGENGKVTSESAGEGRDRHVVISPVKDGSSAEDVVESEDGESEEE